MNTAQRILSGRYAMPWKCQRAVTTVGKIGLKAIEA